MDDVIPTWERRVDGPLEWRLEVTPDVRLHVRWLEPGQYRVRLWAGDEAVESALCEGTVNDAQTLGVALAVGWIAEVANRLANHLNHLPEPSGQRTDVSAQQDARPDT